MTPVLKRTNYFVVTMLLTPLVLLVLLAPSIAFAVCTSDTDCNSGESCVQLEAGRDYECYTSAGTASTPSEAESAAQGLRGAVGIFNIAKEKAGFVGQQTSPEIVAGQIIQGLILVIGVIFGILIIYAGFLWMTARGNEETVKKAISILQNSVIGFILVIAAYAITHFVVNRVIGAAFQ